MRSFSNQVAATTGAASDMGRSLVLQLAREGCHFALADRNEAALVQTLRLMRAHEGGRIRVITYTVDVADRAAAYCQTEEAAAAYGKVNLIFNNTDVALSSTIGSVENDELTWIMNINFRGVAYGIRAFLPLLEATGNDRIINTSNIFDISAQPDMDAYNISKYVIRGHTGALRRRLGLMDCGVSATCVHPGGIRTDIARSSRVSPDMNGSLVRDEQQGRAEFKRFFIASVDKAAQVTLDGVRKNRHRALIDPDAHAVDVIACVLSVVYRALVVREAHRTRKKALCDDMAPATACARQEVSMDTVTTGELLASPSRASLLNVARAMLRPGRIDLCSIGCDVLIARYVKLQSHYLPLVGTHVHHADEGAADPGGTLLLIHGLGASLHTWDGVLPQLTWCYRVIRLGLPPLGITGPLRDAQGRLHTTELPLYRDFINAFVDTLGLPKLMPVGNSLDSMTSQDFATRHSGRVEKLMLIDSAGLPIKLSIYVNLFNHIGMRMTSPWVLPEGIVRAVTHDVYDGPSHVSGPTLRRCADFFYVDGARQAIGKIVPKFRFDDVDTNGLASIRASTLIPRGQRNRWVPPACAGEFVHRIPGATPHMYPALGHIPVEGNPVCVGTDLCIFLDQGCASTHLSETTFQENRP